MEASIFRQRTGIGSRNTRRERKFPDRGLDLLYPTAGTGAGSGMSLLTESLGKAEPPRSTRVSSEPEGEVLPLAMPLGAVLVTPPALLVE